MTLSVVLLSQNNNPIQEFTERLREYGSMAIKWIVVLFLLALIWRIFKAPIKAWVKNLF